jgi:RND family efflux transporter MFP subunit
MSSSSGTEVGTGARKGVAGALAAALGLGIAALIGVRVKETLGERKAMASALADQARAAPKRSGAAVVHGVPRSFRPTLPVTGTLEPVQQADVGFKTGGKLVAVRAKVGDRVRAGQQIAALDVTELSAQSAATSAGVRAAQVSYDMAKDAEKRTLALFAEHAVSDAENLAAQNRAALALAQLEQARAQAQLASAGVSNGSLAAPFAGLVTRAPDGIGKIVAPGEPLFHLEDTQVLKLSATLSEADARLVEVGAAVASTEGWAGKVTAVLPSLDAQTRRVPLVAEIANTGAAPLLAGSFVRATVTSSREVTVIELPPGTLRPGSQDEVVVLAAGKAQIHRVLFTQGEGGEIFVRSGVSAADAVVLNPSSEVREGDDLGGGSAPAAALAAPSPPASPSVH